MSTRRKVTALFLALSPMAWLPASDAFAVGPNAPVTPIDMTDFITRLGGYLFQIPKGPAGNMYYYWEQVSYSVTASAASTASTSSTASSNITKIVMTKLPMASVYKLTGSGATTATTLSAATSTAPAVNVLNPCNAHDYIVETVTLDMRDLELGYCLPANPAGEDGSNSIFQWP